MIKKFAILASIILGGLGAFQVLLIFGFPLGRFAWGGQNEVLPIGYKLGSVFSIFTYAAIATFILQKAQVIKVFKKRKMVDVAMWVITAYFGLGVLLNLASRSPAERNLMTPIVLALFILCFLVSRGSRAAKNQ